MPFAYLWLILLNQGFALRSYLLLFLVIFTSNAFAQQVIEVNSREIDLGEIRETMGLSTKRVLLKVSVSSPEEFKVKFNYKYRFVSHELDNVFVGANGNLGYSTRVSSSDNYDADTKLVFDISESSVSRGDQLDLLVEISKPNQNAHGIKVVVTLKDAKGNVVSGGRKFLGLLGRSYKVTESICD